MGFIVPAVLPSSEQELEEKIELFSRIPSVSRAQIDVVDGKFASPACWPYVAPQELNDRVRRGLMLPHLDRIEYEIDLMCFDAERAVKAWLALGATRLTIHAESAISLPRLLASIRDQYGSFISFGLALNIASKLSLLEPCLGEIEYVQFMGIARIGQQGQPLDERIFEKVRAFRNRHPELSVQVDGGVTLENAKKLAALGVSNLVVGSGLLRARDPAVAFEEFEAVQSSYGV